MALMQEPAAAQGRKEDAGVTRKRVATPRRRSRTENGDNVSRSGELVPTFGSNQTLGNRKRVYKSYSCRLCAFSSTVRVGELDFCMLLI